MGAQVANGTLRGLKLKADDLAGCALTSLLVVRNIAKFCADKRLFAVYESEVLGLWGVEKYSKLAGAILENL
jgi:hypothetical protein